ncbi:acetylxylan esterase [Cellulomonas sp. NPDC089187]|uniref:acetylxylan esterase n=1 Tax=Cellulomonas sp. NPDC089187 TaxID=3154970 RepID=UPI003443B90F
MPPDFDAFWARTLAEQARQRLDLTVTAVNTPLTQLRVHDVRFTGADGQRVAAWWIVPAHAPGPVPVIVQFMGYGGGRASWMTHLLWAAAGYGHLVVDTRGQGTDTGDEPAARPEAPSWGPGFVTRGLDDRETYYYRRVFVDAVRAVAAVDGLPGADPERISVLGTSQGGGIALACASLEPRVRAVLVDVPFMCDWRAGVRDAATPPYREVAEYVRMRPGSYDRVHGTLDYFDAVNFARRATAPAIVAIAAEDTVCPAPGVRAMVAAYAGPVQAVEYPYGDHVDGGFYREHAQIARQLVWLAERGLAPAR